MIKNEKWEEGFITDFKEKDESVMHVVSDRIKSYEEVRPEVIRLACGTRATQREFKSRPEGFEKNGTIVGK